MEAVPLPHPPLRLLPPQITRSNSSGGGSNRRVALHPRSTQVARRRRRAPPTRINAVVGVDGVPVPPAADLAAPVEITWQIVVGAVAGIMPFVVAGIEFSKRIIAQRKCEVCQGSGLVALKDESYARCPQCGGFLPWQSWKRFFTG